MPLPPGWHRLQLAPFVLGFSLVPRTPLGEGLEYPSYPTTCTVLTSRTVPSSSSCAVTLNGCGSSSKPCCPNARRRKSTEASVTAWLNTVRLPTELPFGFPDWPGCHIRPFTCLVGSRGISSVSFC